MKRIVIPAFAGLALVACGSSESSSGGNPFTVRYFSPAPPDPEAEALDCTPLPAFSPHNPQCLFGDPPAMAGIKDLPDGTYHLTSFRGQACNGPWIDASMRVQRLSDGRLFIKERRPMTQAFPQNLPGEYLHYEYLVKPGAQPPVPPAPVPSCKNVAVSLPLEFTILDGANVSGRATVAIRVEEFYVLVYEQD